MFQRRWVEGKTIAEMDVRRETDTNHGMPIQAIERIVFTDGSQLRFLVHEPEEGSEYYVEPAYDPPARKRKD